MSDTSDLLFKVGAGRFASIFDCLVIAEEEVAAAKAAHPGVDLSGVFLALCPPPGFTELAPEVYRSHARELVARAVSGQDLSDGTDAECLVAFMEMATRAPLNSLGSACAHRLFQSIFGKGADDSPPPVEPWKGAVDEALQQVRRKIGARNGRTSRLPSGGKVA